VNNTAIVGNLVRDPKLSYSSGEKRTAIARFTIAVNEGQGDKEKAHFVSFTAFGTLAENMADSLRQGMRVVAIGRLDTYLKTVEIDGEEKNLTMTGFVASAIGPDLRWAVAKVAKVERDNDSDPRPARSGNGRPKAAESGDDEDQAPSRAQTRSTAKSRVKVPAPADANDDF